MRDLLYLSTGKIENQLLFKSRTPLPGLDVEASLTGPKVKITSPSARPNQENISRLEAAIKQLDRERQPRWYTNAGLRPGDWMRFELQMVHRTSHKDDAHSWLPDHVDDIALFAGPTSPRATRQESEVQVLLCGSACHLTTQTTSGGRLGSSSDWFYRAMKDVHQRVEQGDENLPTEFFDTVNGSWEITEIPYGIYRWMYDEYFSAQLPLLSGYAQVWMNLDASEWAPRLIVGTPLFVEIGPPPPRRKWWRPDLSVRR